MKKNDILLSVIIISYKQVKYIKEAIDSVIKQKVNFKYELLLADDCSCDGTLEIMKEYEKKYDFIKVLDRPKNLGGTNNAIDAYSHAKGKYITCLEGDDYWIDENKLQIQVDFLENNEDYIAITHLQQGRDLNNNILGNFPKGIKKDFTIDGVNDIINGKRYSSSSTLYRNIYKDEFKFNQYKTLMSYHSVIGDAQSCAYMSSLGKIKVLAKPMMVYRIRNNDGKSNFNSTHKVNEIQLSYLKIYLKLNEFFDYKYDFYKQIKYCYTLGVAYSICKFDVSKIKEFNKTLLSKYKLRIYLLFPITCFSILFDRFIRK